MFGNDRTQLRRYYLETWQRYCRHEPLDALGLQIAAVISEHPEYHALLSAPLEATQKDFGPEDGTGNPFLHLGMHLAIREQVATDRPPGIGDTYRQLTLKFGDAHAAEHGLMECLGTALWEAQRSGTLPDEKNYLECAKKLV